MYLQIQLNSRTSEIHNYLLLSHITTCGIVLFIREKLVYAYVSSRTSGLIYRLVPTLGFVPMSSWSGLSLDWICVTAKPKSAITHVPLFFTRMFFVLMSRWAIAALHLNVNWKNQQLKRALHLNVNWKNQQLKRITFTYSCCIHVM